jgi:hypothetical protein
MQVYNGTSWTNINGSPAAPLQIGDLVEGGIVFYIAPTPTDLDGDSDLDTGLVCSLQDVGSGAWGCQGTLIGTGTAIGTGNQNTISIDGGCTTAGIPADICQNLTLDGYSDWFLPSKDELNQIYEKIGQGNALGLGNIGNFVNTFYWSSTEDNSSFAWERNFFNGSQIGASKASAIFVRAVRAF